MKKSVCDHADAIAWENAMFTMRRDTKSGICILKRKFTLTKY